MNPWVDKETLFTIVPFALAYGGFHAWRFWKKKIPPLCKVLRYLLGYWLGSTIYIIICIVFPLTLSICVTVLYFFPNIVYKIKF
ncbi:MAG: hypothetical protein V4525_07080 [Pseudomonadota bacterium]